MSDQAATPDGTGGGPPGSAAPAGAEAICSACDGSGRVDGQQCSTCGGSGKVVEPVGGA